MWLNRFFLPSFLLLSYHSKLNTTAKNKFTVYKLSRLFWPTRAMAYFCIDCMLTAEYCLKGFRIRMRWIKENTLNSAWLCWPNINLIWINSCNINQFDINRGNRNVFINETGNKIIQMDVEKFCVLLTLGCIDRNSIWWVWLIKRFHPSL